MKGEIEFNWIFMLIAGVVILAFFFSFGIKYKNLQEEKLSIELLINLDNALLNLQSSSFNTFDKVDIPKDVKINCNELKIQDKNYKNTKFIFSPKELRDKIYIWFKPFNFPFKIDNFYYLISPKDKFYLIYNDQASKEFAESLINDLPEKFKDNIKAKNSRQPDGKNIFINSNQGEVNINLNNEKINLNVKNKLYEDVSKELVYGAIFSDDFDCNYKKIKLSMEEIINNYKKKLVILQSSTCSYASIPNYLSKLKDLKFQDTKSIEELNKNLASINCPTLY